MKPPFDIEWRMVTPAEASQWLAKQNAGNRSMRDETVRVFSQDMLAGAWSPNHQGIAFAKDGRLLDGQHRLAAIERSGVSVPLLVCTNVPDRCDGVTTDVMDTVDRGNSRTIADLLRLQHGYKVNANLIAASASVIAHICADNPRQARRMSMPQTVVLVERYREGLAFISENRTSKIGLRSATICGALAFAYQASSEADRNAIKTFYARLAMGAGLAEGDPILTFRNHALSDSNVRQIHMRRNLADLTLHTIWCHLRNFQMPRIPTARPGADHYRAIQKENVDLIAAMFPTMENMPEPSPTPQPPPTTKPVIKEAIHKIATEANVKLTPLAESLIRGKEMSERINRKITR